jgi:dephospho-CoA kinase
MKVIGLTGSIAMGKSEVAKFLRQRGIPVFDADAAVHELYRDGSAARTLRTDTGFAAAVRGTGVDRTILSKLVQDQPARLQRLESLIHPLVHQRRTAFLREAQASGARLAVLDIPLLFETGADREVDAVLLVSAPAALQRRRALLRPGMTEEKLDLILARQMPDAEKRLRAHFIIDNAGDLGDLGREVDRVLAALTAT